MARGARQLPPRAQKLPSFLRTNLFGIFVDFICDDDDVDAFIHCGLNVHWSFGSMLSCLPLYFPDSQTRLLSDSATNAPQNVTVGV